MATIDETAYPRLKPDPSAQELDEVYTPSDEERAFAARVARTPLARLGVLLQLKLCQRLGYLPPLATVPPFLVRHLAKRIGIQRSDVLMQLQHYDRSATSRQHRGQVRDFLRLRMLDPAGRRWLLGVAQTAAQTKPRLEDIINAMLEELVHQRYELPAFSTLERLAFQGREAVHKRVFDQLNGALTPAQRSQIDALFVARGGERTTPWQGLKREIRKPTHQEVRSYLQHVQYLKVLRRVEN